MSKRVSKWTMNELVKVLARHYASCRRTEKTRILDEFARITGYHRKHAIRLLLNSQAGRTGAVTPSTESKRLRRSRIYDGMFVEALVVLWEAADRISGKRLVPLIPQLLPAIERDERKPLDASVRTKLLTVSPATVDRLLRPARREALIGRQRLAPPARSREKPIPVCTKADVNEPKVGMLKIELVCHGGERTKRNLVHSLVITDIASGWTECVVLPTCDSDLVIEGLSKVRTALPFAILGLASDSGNKFIDEHLARYCKENAITFTRSRPYQKCDQAWTDQKKEGFARKMVGSARFEGLVAAHSMATLYEVSRLYVNFFHPSVRPHDRRDEAGREKKRSATPCEHVLGSSEVNELTRCRLREIRESLDPIALLDRIRAQQKNLARIAAGQRTHETS